MKAKFSAAWRASSQPRKQRKYRYNAPLHIRQSFVAAHLSPELREKYSRRAVPVIRGDTIKVMRGSSRGRTGTVNRVDLKLSRIFVDGIDLTKRDGTKAFRPIEPSNVMITELKLDDKKRIKVKSE